MHMDVIVNKLKLIKFSNTHQLNNYSRYLKIAKPHRRFQKYQFFIIIALLISKAFHRNFKQFQIVFWHAVCSALFKHSYSYYSDEISLNHCNDFMNIINLTTLCLLLPVKEQILPTHIGILSTMSNLCPLGAWWIRETVGPAEESEWP